MLKEAISRRHLFEAGAAGLAATALATSATGADALSSGASTNEAVVRSWYKLWATEKKNWSPFDAFMTDDFTFTSPNHDDHISKSAFKKRCWDTQIGYIDRINLEFVTVKGNEALVKYLCYTKNGKSFRNVEYLQLRHGRIAAIECYFGGNMTFPSAVSSQKS